MAKAKVVIRKDRCKGCELCISVCPKHILAIDDAEVNINGYHAVNIIAEEEGIAWWQLRHYVSGWCHQYIQS